MLDVPAIARETGEYLFALGRTAESCRVYHHVRAEELVRFGGVEAAIAYDKRTRCLTFAFGQVATRRMNRFADERPVTVSTAYDDNGWAMTSFGICSPNCMGSELPIFGRMRVSAFDERSWLDWSGSVCLRVPELKELKTPRFQGDMGEETRRLWQRQTMAAAA